MIQARKRRIQSGFTLIELIVVITIIGMLAAIAVIQVRNATRKAQESALRQDLHDMRSAIDNYYADKQKYPGSLNDLVPNYLRAIPPDPITKQADWAAVPYAPSPDDPDAGAEMSSPSTDTSGVSTGPGIDDVKCTAPGKTLDGVSYSDL